mmetsp:Transcript_25439/g.41485  ORF Transcript_25439/g.41485 Transcript_25439/m.41485 type:complete len:215 (-) Transcript_25439:34-678(-)|eukprot:CAMPEP_0202701832 /NCGR_PEP_ID=MMETSP1385-20130828/14883_1 /ASSEMBLY_ACC=CAM_ASM_000861 /TAXON_ID=933848 /ORGANISM="Elphidium margaritaceum" /LENGTH=214 /DNA_ID=CAMNT_0049359339 /DNA_START=20 /DNA_END=664 /DNA_ORIENTATION=-
MSSSAGLVVQCALFMMMMMYCTQCSVDYTVEHQLSATSAWTVRGRLLMDVTARSGSLSIHDWSDQEMDEWHALSRQSQSMYKLRIKLSDTNYLSASVLACQLKRGDERIILHSDFDGNLIAFDYFTTNPACTDSALSSSSSSSSSSSLPKTLQKSVEDISILSGDKADGPFFAEYEISPPKKEQQSLWGKYWWIILIVGFVVLQSVAASAGGGQ